MCPVCIATAAPIAGKVTSASGAAAIAIRKPGVKKVDTTIPLPPRPSYVKETTQQDRSFPNSNQRRDHYANDCDSER
jgi:hypothetical protein